MIASVYVPFFYIEEYSLALSVSPALSLFMLAFMNAASLLGRLAPNYLADLYGGISIMLPCCLLSALALFLFRFAHTQPSLIAISVIYGFISGGMVSLPPAIIANLTENPDQYGTRMGMAYTVCAFGALVGNPLAGAARRSGHVGVVERYQGTWILAGAVMLSATMLLVVVKWKKGRG